MVSPLQWDWETLIMSNPSKTENDKRQLSKGEGIESIVPCLAALERVSCGGSKSSQSTSINSSSPKVKHSECSPGDSCSNVDFVQVKASTTLELSVASAESDLCLQLGKRTYSEELWGRNSNDISAISVKLLTPSVVARKKSKSCGQSFQVMRCQIDGCELDLSSAKAYHRKHRICESHSKCPKVVVSGLERRFCQQCSRLHAVSEFDGKKRSCRKRLSHHNARRRKPQGVFPLNRVHDRKQHTSMLWNGLSPNTKSAETYTPADRKQHTNMLWNGLSLNTRSAETYTWGTTFETKPTQMESGFSLSFQRGHGLEEQLFASSGRSFSSFQTSGGFSAAKSNFQLPDKGVGECSGGFHESQDLYSALSLLSTSSDSRGTKHNPLIEAQPIFGTFPTHFI